MNSANPRDPGHEVAVAADEYPVRRTGLADLAVRLNSTWVSRISLAVLLLFLLVAVFGPLLAPHDPADMGRETLQAPNAQHWMGTDEFGRDVFSRFLEGTRVSVFVGLAAVAIACAVGTIAGMVAGFNSGRIWDGLIMRGMDIVLAFPLLVLVPVVTGLLGKSGINLGPVRLTAIPLMTLAIALVFVPIFARVARSSVLAEMEEEYIVAVRTFGARRRHILLNLLPNITAPLIVQAAFAFGGAVVVEAAVSFLGLGVQAPNASWGTLLADGRNFLTLGCWWLAAFPSLALALTVLSFNLLGDDLRDHLDPRARSSVRKFSRRELAKS